MATKNSGTGGMQAAFTALQVGMSLWQGREARALAGTQRQVNASIQKAQKGIQTAGNFRAAAFADLGRAVQSVQNRRMRAQATRREAAGRAAVLAQRDADSAGSFERRIGASEQAGALAGLAVNQGVVGGSYDIIQSARSLAEARQQFADKRAGRARDYGIEVDSADAARTAVTGLDNKTVFATLDRSVIQRQPAGTPSSPFEDIVRGTTPDRLLGLAEYISVEAEPLARSLYNRIKGETPAYVPIAGE